MTDDFDTQLSAMLAPPADADADADAFADEVIHRLGRRDIGRTVLLTAASAAGVAVFAWQLVARFDAVGTALHALVGGLLQSVEMGSAALLALALATMLAGRSAGRPSAR